jgi:hypothetical protein
MTIAARTIDDPAGATKIFDWELLGTNNGHPNVIRAFEGTRRGIDLEDQDIDVSIEGLQGYADEGVERFICVGGEWRLTVDQARELAWVLLDAVCEADVMAAYDQGRL